MRTCVFRLVRTARRTDRVTDMLADRQTDNADNVSRQTERQTDNADNVRSLIVLSETKLTARDKNLCSNLTRMRYFRTPLPRTIKRNQ